MATTKPDFTKMDDAINNLGLAVRGSTDIWPARDAFSVLVDAYKELRGSDIPAPTFVAGTADAGGSGSGAGEGEGEGEGQ